VKEPRPFRQEQLLLGRLRNHVWAAAAWRCPRR
jgi:hypothetical protein